ncbi:hypothetical protein J3E68DRAFT_24500 [Trichoderma sp. SZMC 28012]
MRGAKQRKAKRRKSREKQARLQRNKVPEPVPESGQRGSAWVPGQCKGRGCELLWTKASEWVIVKGLDAETVASPGMAMAGRKQKRWPTKKLNFRPAAEPVARDGWLARQTTAQQRSSGSICQRRPPAQLPQAWPVSLDRSAVARYTTWLEAQVRQRAESIAHYQRYRALRVSPRGNPPQLVGLLGCNASQRCKLHVHVHVPGWSLSLGGKTKN